MTPYHKIPTVYKRNPDNNYKTLLEGQWATSEIAYLADCEWEFTEKIDGTNIRVIFDKDHQLVTFGGRKEKSQIPAHLWGSLVQMFPERKFLEQDYSSMTLYGEGFGKGIQKVGSAYNPDEASFILFDVKIGDYWLNTIDVFEVGTKLDIPLVPLVGYGPLALAVEWAREGFRSRLNHRMDAEGLVMRPVTQMFDRAGKRIIVKIKLRDFPQ